MIYANSPKDVGYASLEGGIQKVSKERHPDDWGL